MSIALVLTCNEQIENKAKYVFDTFLHVLGIRCLEEGTALDAGSILIGYGELTTAMRSRMLNWIRDNNGIGLSGREVVRMWEARHNA